MNTQIKIGIVGATGYTGVELLRLLSTHPHARVTAVTSRSEAGMPVADYFPSLRGVYDLVFQTPEEADLAQCDLVFFATPHGVAMRDAPGLIAQGVRVVDLSADFRIQDIPTWEKWYGMPFTAAEALKEAVYGLCELNREQIKSARLIANPGCYPTCVSLPLLPLLQQSLLKAVRRRAQSQRKHFILRSGRQFQSLWRGRPPPPARNQANHPQPASRSG